MFNCAIGCEHIHVTTEVNLSIISITLTSKDCLSNQRSSQKKKAVSYKTYSMQTAPVWMRRKWNCEGQKKTSGFEAIEDGLTLLLCVNKSLRLSWPSTIIL